MLELLLAPVRVPVPEAELEGWPLLGEGGAPAGGSAQAALDELIELCTGHHDLAVEPIDLAGYAASGLPATTMGRSIEEDPLFFAAPLAAGRALAAPSGVERPRDGADRVEDASTRAGSSRSTSTSSRYDDGETAEREIVVHPGAVGIVAHDDERVYLVRQPREAVGEPALLELPAGKLDVEGESPLECAQRELGEEIGMRAADWTELKRFYTSPGFAQEEVTLFVATGLEEIADHEPDPEERIEIVPWPLADLDGAIDECVDSKSLIGLLLLARGSLR